MIKILVTGANGLLGQKLSLLLDRDQNVALTVTVRGKLNFDLTRGQFIKLDVTDADEVLKVVTSAKPDVVIHTAAMTHVDRCETEQEACWKNNVTAVGYLVHACERNSAHFIHISTDFIFDGSYGPLDETALPNPISYYGQSKLAAEEAIQKSKINWTILRTVLVYGVVKDLSRLNIVLWVKDSLEAGKAIQVVNDQWRTPTLAEDLALGCVLAAKKKARGIFHVSGEEMMTPFDIAIKTAEYFKLDKTLIQATDSNHFKQPAKRPPKTGFIIEKAKKELGFRPRTFEEGLSVVGKQLK